MPSAPAATHSAGTALPLDADHHTSEMPDKANETAKPILGAAGRPEPEPGGGEPLAPHVSSPLPKLTMMVVGATFLTESICSTMLLPFVGLYVAHLQHISVEDAGYYSGILVGLFSLGQVMGSKMWGWLSDVYGRRAPLIFGLFCAAWTMFFFGMATNIYVCCFLRLLHGFFNGNVLIAKIIIADVTDRSNAAHGFAVVGFTWSLGCILGPAIGGFLYDPSVNPSLWWLGVSADSFVGRNPAFLASFVIFAYTLVNLMMCIFLLKETNPTHTGSLRNVPVLGWILNFLRPKEVTVVNVSSARRGAGLDEFEEEEEEEPRPDATGELTFMQAIKDPILSTICVLYMCISGSDMCFGEIMPLWAIAPKKVGGLAMFADEVGGLMLLFAVPTFISTFFFSLAYNAVHDSALFWQGGMALFVISSVLFPCAAGMSDRAAFWFVLILGSIRDVMCSALYDVVHILTAKSAPPGSLGAAYGITQSMASLTRCGVPFVVAPVFAWSINGNHRFPFNHYFVFLLSAVPLIYSIYRSWAYPLERTSEELAAWDDQNKATAARRRRRGGGELDSMVEDEYRSLANSFVGSHADNILPHLQEMENARQGMIADWMRQTAPRGGTAQLEWAVKALQQEDWRIVTDEDENRNPEEEEDRGEMGFRESERRGEKTS